MATYEERESKARIGLGTGLLLGGGLLYFNRKKVATFAARGISKFIKSTVGDFSSEAASLEFRPSTRLASELNRTVSNIKYRSALSRRAGALFSHEGASLFDRDLLKKAVGLGNPLEEGVNRSLYYSAFRGDRLAKNAEYYGNLVNQGAFTEVVSSRAAAIQKARNIATADAHSAAKNELATLLTEVNTKRFRPDSSGSREFLDFFEKEYLHKNQDTTADTILGFFGVKRNRLSSDSAWGDAVHSLTDQKKGALGRGVSVSRSTEFLESLGNVKTSHLLNVNGEEFDFSELPTAISKVYNKLRERVQIPTVPGMGGFAPFSFFPQLRGQSPNIIHEIDQFSSLPFLNNLVGDTKGLGTLYVVGKKSSAFSFSGKGKFIGRELLSTGRREALDRQTSANSILQDLELDVRDAKSGFLKTLHNRAIEQMYKAKGSLPVDQPTSLIGNLLAKADPQSDIGRSIKGAMQRADSALTSFFTTGGQEEHSLLQKGLSVFTKYKDENFILNVYRNRLLKGGEGTIDDVKHLVNYIQKSKGYIDPSDIRSFIQDSQGLRDSKYSHLLKMDASGKRLLLEDDRQLLKALSEDTDISDIMSDRLAEAIRNFKNAPETSVGYGQNNDIGSIFSEMGMDVRSGLLGQANKSQGLDHIRELILEESLLKNRRNSIDLIQRSRLSSRSKNQFQALFKASHYQFETAYLPVNSVINDIRSKESVSILDEFMTRTISPFEPFLPTNEIHSSRYLVMPHRRSASARSFSAIRTGDPITTESLREGAEELRNNLIQDHLSPLQEAFSHVKDAFTQGNTFTNRLSSLKEARRSLLSSKLGVKYRGFVYGLKDPEAFSSEEFTPYFLSTRLNDQFLNPLGLGLGKEDLYSTYSIWKALLLKRALPVVGGVRALDYLENRSDKDNSISPSMALANVRSRRDLAMARFSDRTGLTRVKKKIADLLPGSREFLGLDPKSEEEYKEYLDHGKDPVRKGRGWLFGSRTPWAGEGVSYFEPNFFLRAQSRYETVSGGRKSDESFSLDPYALEKSQSMGPFAPRPYPISGPLVDPHIPGAFIINNTLGRLIKPQINLQKNGPADRGLQLDDYLLHSLPISGLLPENHSPQGSGGGGGFGAGGGRGPGGGGGGNSYYNTSSPSVRNRVGSPYGYSTKSPYEDAPVGLINISANGNFNIVTTPDGVIPEPYKGAYYGRAVPGISLSKKQVERLNRRLAQMGSGFTRMPGPWLRTASSESNGGEEPLDPRSLRDQSRMVSYQSQQLAGIYGFMTGLLPGMDFGSPEYQSVIADSSLGFGLESRFWEADRGGSFLGLAGMGIDQPLNELVRRFIPHRRRTLKYVNDIPNQFYGSDWLPNGDSYFLDFQRGDPYALIKQGSARLPGEAYNRLYRPEIMSLRASSAGKSAEEMVDMMLHKKSTLSDYGEQVTELGTKLHAQVEHYFKRQGLAVATELSVADKELGMKGSIDLILRTNRGYEVVDLKTVGQKKFEKIVKSGRALEEHMRQIAVYQHITGIKKGRVLYASRETGEVIDMASDFSQKRFNDIRNNVKEARKVVFEKLQNREVSYADLYDDVTKYEILSDVAPYSMERKALERSLSRSDQLSELDRKRIKDAKERASTQKERVELFDYRFKNIKERTKSTSFVIEGFRDGGGFYVKGSTSPVKLAGGTISKARIKKYMSENGIETPEGMSQIEAFYKHFGIVKGRRISAITDADPDLEYRDDTENSRRVVIGDINRKLIDSGVMSESETDNTPTGVLARYSKSDIALGSIFETVAHADTILNSKFLRVRSPLEAYKRQVVYGTTEGSWEDPYNTYIKPTINAIASKDPISAGLIGGFVATLPFILSKDKKKAAVIGAAVGASLSLLRSGYESISGKKWMPSEIERRREIDQYFDIISYIKYRGLYEKEAERAKVEDHVDIDNIVQKFERFGKSRKHKRNILNKIKYREELNLSKLNENSSNYESEKKKILLKLESVDEALGKLDVPMGHLAASAHVAKALKYREKYQGTLYGASPGSPLMNIIGAMPKNERDILSKALKSSARDKKELYKLLSDDQKRVLGLHLGMDFEDLPKRIQLNEYFKNHFLPDVDSEIWDENVDINDLKARAYDHENIRKVELGIFPQVLAQAEQRTEGIAVPYRYGQSHGSVATSLNTILSGKNHIGGLHSSVRHMSKPRTSSYGTIRLEGTVRENRRSDMINAINDQY